MHSATPDLEIFKFTEILKALFCCSEEGEGGRYRFSHGVFSAKNRGQLKIPAPLFSRATLKLGLVFLDFHVLLGEKS